MTLETLKQEKERVTAKTFKREVAVLLLSFLCYTIYGGDVEMVKIIVYPFMAFAGLSFGLDWKSKQG